MEVLIALFINDNFIRPYVGDVLVVILIYCFIRIFVARTTKLLPLGIFIFAVGVEIGQYFNLAQLLGLADYKVARIIIGSTFDLKDIACYLTGCGSLFLYEEIKRRRA
jgi:DNA integrity scanning protein DisA with diadenylate cyclase activity